MRIAICFKAIIERNDFDGVFRFFFICLALHSGAGFEWKKMNGIREKISFGLKKIYEKKFSQTELENSSRKMVREDKRIAPNTY